MSNDTLTNEQRAMAEQELRQLGQEIASMQRRVEFNSNRVLDMGPTIDAGVTGRISNALIANASLANIMTDIEANRVAVNAAQELLAGMDGTTLRASISGAVNTAVNRAFEAVGAATGNFSIGGAWSDMITGLDNAGVDAATGRPITIALVDNDGSQGANVTAVLGNLNTRINDLNREATRALTAAQMIAAASNYEFGEIRSHVSNAGSGDNVAYFQVGANASQGITYDFERVARAVTGAAATVQLVGAISSMPGAGSGIGGGVGITQLIDRVAASIDDISTVRANLGAVQNRLDYTMRSLDISSENLQNSESRVRNADVAREMMRFTMSNVLQQAAVSMLSQANQLPQNLLQLLR
jgi:flagellin